MPTNTFTNYWTAGNAGSKSLLHGGACTLEAGDSCGDDAKLAADRLGSGGLDPSDQKGTYVFYCSFCKDFKEVFPEDDAPRCPDCFMPHGG